MVYFSDLTMIVQFFLLLIFSRAFSLQDYSGPRYMGRIVGGSRTRIEEFPYQVSLQRMGFHICGGTIISSSWILTAGHCIFDRDRSLYTVRSGSSYHDSGGRISQVRKILVHEKFNGTSYDNDITAIQLMKPLLFNAHTIPVPITGKTDFLAAGDIATVTGWGKVSAKGNPSRILRRVEVPLVSFAECAKAYVEHPITERMVCAGLLNVGTKDACQGDSGGPLVLNGKLIGIVSWGFGCAQPTYPGVYTRVRSFRDWIQRNTGI